MVRIGKISHGVVKCIFAARRWLPGVALVLFLNFAVRLSAAIIGTNTPASPLTLKRIATLPAEQRPVWREYLKRSQDQRRADQSFLETEMRKRGLKIPLAAPEGHSANSIPLDRPVSWYGSAEAARIANIIVSFQTPAGGWSKNLNMAEQARVPGESFAPDNGFHRPGKDHLESPLTRHWEYVGTFDNNATVSELRFLAKVITAAGTNQPASWRASFHRGLDYIFAAQYPDGGWPQVWPLQGGYHDAITYNDNAMVNVLDLLSRVSSGANEFAFVSPKTRRLAAASLRRGLQCVLATQIVVDGRRTVWCQQHDPLTLQPVSARNYEMPAETSSESARIMMFLMAQPYPGPKIIKSVNAAAAWFKKTQIHNMAFEFVPGRGRCLVPKPGYGPIWARYYQIGTDRPIFGDRDKTIHDNVNEISEERRNGYSWYNDAPQKALARYAEWKKRLSE